MSNKDINYLHVYQFEERTRTAWQESLIQKEFCDIILSCENKQIQAHKIILSSYSAIFSNILRQSSNSHQIIYLRGVKYTELQNMLTLMYEGEVSIAEDDIDSFLNVADDLKISGLSKGDKHDKSMENSFSQIELIPKRVYGQPNMIEIDKLNGKYFNLNLEDNNEKNIDNRMYIPEFNFPTKMDENELTQTTGHVAGMINANKNYTENADVQDIKEGILEKSTTYTERLHLYEDKLSNKNHSQGTENYIDILEGIEETSSDKEYFAIKNSNKLLKIEKFSCEKCEYKTEDKSKLKIHIESIHESQIFSCNECNFETKSTNRLKNHVDMIHKKMYHSCEQCEKVYKNKYDLKKHVDTIHETNPSYQCKLCEHLARNEYFLNRHVALIHGEKVHFCTPCNKQLSNKSSLLRHRLSVHEGVRYSCDQCNLTVTENGTLKRHIRSVHEGVRHPCVICDYKAKSKCNLKKHIISIHESGGSHLCEKCDFRAPWKSALKEHIEATHEGILYPCNQCNFKGTRMGILKKHIKAIHEGLRYLCDQCEYKGTAKSSLITHIERRH